MHRPSKNLNPCEDFPATASGTSSYINFIALEVDAKPLKQTTRVKINPNNLLLFYQENQECLQNGHFQFFFYWYFCPSNFITLIIEAAEKTCKPIIKTLKIKTKKTCKPMLHALRKKKGVL